MSIKVIPTVLTKNVCFWQAKKMTTPTTKVMIAAGLTPPLYQ